MLTASKTNHYDPSMMFDGNRATAWVEGEDDDGIGQSITLHFDRKRSLVGFEIINGYDKDQKIWAANSRVETVEASTGDGQVQVITLKDVRGTSRFDFDAPIETSWLQAHHPERLPRFEIPRHGDQRALSDLRRLTFFWLSRSGADTARRRHYGAKLLS